MSASLRRIATRVLLAFAAVVVYLLSSSVSAHAGTLTRAWLQQRFPSPLIVGERDAQVPVWPLFRQDGTATPLVGYVFESIDLAPIPGFSGTPPDLLIALDAKGVFMDVQVLSQHEPVFLDGLGPEPLDRFVAQYKGLSLRQNIKVGSAEDRHAQVGGANVRIDGVTKATASVRIINQTLMSSALRVARAKLGYAAGRDPDRLARVPREAVAAGASAPSRDWRGLVDDGFVQSLVIRNADVARAFEGTGIEGDAGSGGAGAGPPDAAFVELKVVYLSTAVTGRALMGEGGWRHLQDRLDDGDHAILVLARGPGSFVGDDWVRGAVPERLTLKQGELPIEWRDLDLDDPLALPADWRGADAKVLRVIGPAGLDPAQPLDITLQVVRSKGIVYPERVRRGFTMRYAVPRDFVVLPADESQSWVALWRERRLDIAVLLVALAGLAAVLARPRWLGWLVRDERRLARVRLGYLAFTLGFVGWHAQGQLSIVNLTAAVQSLVAGRSLGFFLQDPMTVLLWAFTAVSLVAWGRGTFCGWLCPVGALQEFVGRLALALGVKRRRLRAALDARLKFVKYGVLAVIIGLAAWPGGATSAWVDRGIEIEPFKTAITLGFVRSWPYVLWAVIAIGSSAVVYKGFCRYLCPLGAGLALLGRVRRLDWIARRAECGTPCQTCRHRCDYQAIAPTGKVDYEECFQCLDCVSIHDSDTRCAPLIQGKRQRVITIRALTVQEGVR